MLWYDYGRGLERGLMALTPFLAFIHKEQLRDPSILDYFREETFSVSFHKFRGHRSPIESRMGVVYNFTIDVEADDPDFMIDPCDVMFNGSWEGFEQHITDDIRYLRTLGLRIEYSGYIEP